MDASARYAELRAALLQARTIRQRLAVLASIRTFLRSLPPGADRTRALVLAGYACAEPLGRWRAVLTYAGRVEAELHHAPHLRPYVLWLQGVGLRRTGHHRAAARVLLEALAGFEGAGNSVNAAEAGEWLVLSLLEAGDVVAAREHLHRITPGPVNALEVAAFLAEAEGRSRDAIILAGEALRLSDKPHDATLRYCLFLLLVRCADRLGDAPARRAAIKDAAEQALSTWYAALARLVITSGEIGGETFVASAAGRLGRGSERIHSSAASGIPGPGVQRRGDAPLPVVARQRAACR